MTPARRVEGGDRFSHQTAAVLEAFATSVLGLHYAIESEQRGVPMGDRTYEWARGAVRCARLLMIKKEYR